ncbi:DeoR family transcriptional regulator [Azorhizobium oxalatiphilum]|uniref:DeoR family transcriptional regulator n=1 Tax=Azorhizobium oxalatiphilum TaxID=980631 RepID=A0A917FE28_9HYPH|nr:DeoR/GlpR family DNA-binding transcription regulator [Azorhizobium oxalatiphilum]GGF69068.1 DeoR family transcriptional regulator [Azorhizobium oxalatiphilum]
MRSKERRSHFLDALRAGEVDVTELSARFGVSPSTVRRDLQRLSKDNAVRRTYGGAILAERHHETTLAERKVAQGRQKQAIARAAAAMIQDGDSLILDAGSTIMALGPFLKGRTLRIVTNNVALLPFLAKEPGLDVTVLGGALRPTGMGTVGALAFDAMRRITADWLFTSADGVVAERGLCEASQDQVALKSLMMQQARQTVVLADATKIGRAEVSYWAPLPARWQIVTDTGVPEDEVAALKTAGGQVLIVRP